MTLARFSPSSQISPLILMLIFKLDGEYIKNFEIFGIKRIKVFAPSYLPGL